MSANEFTPLAGKVCLVTGASRGIGKGIALQLGQNGATVYITGRTLTGPTSLENTAQEVEARGGRCIAVQCDHANDADVRRVFDRIRAEQDARLDILVNNAYGGFEAMLEAITKQKPFWELEPDVFDEFNHVGVRNHYLCSVLAARMMVPRKQGLIVNISSSAGLQYIMNVAFGISKQALDRMAVDCGIELKPHNVACVSLYPGAVRTEKMDELFASGFDFTIPDLGVKMSAMYEFAESAEYSGKAIVSLAKDPNVMKKSARIHFAAELGDEYGFVDINGKRAQNFRRVKELLEVMGYTRLARWIPAFIKIPYWVLTLSASKF